MNIYKSKRNKSIQVLKTLEEEVLSGAILHKEELITRFMGKTNTTLQYLFSQRIVNGWIAGLKKRFTLKHGYWFGCLDNNGGYGLVKQEAEGRSAMTRYYNFTKGVVNRAGFLGKEMRRKGLLSVHEEMVALPKPNGKEKTNE